jgi:hypothetical protein
MVVLEGAVNTEIFVTFLEGLLMEMNPYPGKHSVLVMDNVKFHLSEEVQSMIEDR